MRLLLDECLPRALVRALAGHEVKTVPQMGWASVKNGALLALAEAQFEVFVTIDGGLEFQQNLARFRIAIVALRAKSNRLADVLPLVPEILAALPLCRPGAVAVVGGTTP